MTIGYYIQTLVSFGLIVALLWVSLKYIKKLQIKRLANDMAVIDRLQVSKTSSLLIVQIRKQEYLVGVTENDVKILDKLKTSHKEEIALNGDAAEEKK
jgi:flagellar biogenesis protein FliO